MILWRDDGNSCATQDLRGAESAPLTLDRDRVLAAFFSLA
jgi:hypothetical protein